MDTNLKNAISAMRKDIAELEKQQKTIKPQRKTVHFTGERTVQPWEAANIVTSNRDDLRLYYAAYNLLRGKNFNVTEKNTKPFIYDNGMYYAYPDGIHGQFYTCHEWENGMHPLISRLCEIDEILRKYGYQFKNYEERKYAWGGTFKTPSISNYEEVVCISE